MKNVLSMFALAVFFGFQAQQREQQPRYQPDWPCAGRPDPSYIKVAEGTGGQVYLFHPSELGESAGLAMADVSHDETLLRAVATLDDGLHEYVVPVDTTVERIRLSVWLQCLNVVEIARPDGELLQASDPGIEYHQFQAGRIVTVRQPGAGAWHVRVSGRGFFSLVAQGHSEVSLASVRVASNSEPAGAQAPQATDPPRAGIPQLIHIVVDGPVRELQARLVSGGFRDLRPLELRPLSDSEERHEYIAPVTLRPGTFRVVVTGRDERGLVVQRVHAPLLEAK